VSQNSNKRNSPRSCPELNIGRELSFGHTDLISGYPMAMPEKRFYVGTEMKYREVERKFQITRLPPSFSKYPHETIHQGYLARTTSGTEIRVRKKGKHHILTVKQGTGLKRTEIEIKLTQKEFEILWPMTKGRRVEKVRYRVPYEGVVIEADVYQGKLRGLLTAEVEFHSSNQRHSFQPPDWFGRDLTSNSRYSNWHLARFGISNMSRKRKG
jgi:adenylate cyclase